MRRLGTGLGQGQEATAKDGFVVDLMEQDDPVNWAESPVSGRFFGGTLAFPGQRLENERACALKTSSPSSGDVRATRSPNDQGGP